MTTQKIAVICPTRDRFDMTLQAYNSWKDTNSGCSEFFIIIDSDQTELYKDFPLAPEFILVAPRGRVGMADATNYGAMKLVDKYVAIHFIGCDHNFRTAGWDLEFLKALDALGGWGLVYGNDLLQGASLPTECMISSNIIKTLGWMIPPSLSHLYIDNAWLDIGRGIQKMTYLPSVIVEHMHYSVGKSIEDESYKIVNSSELYGKDSKAYDDWLNTTKTDDIRKVVEAINA